MFYTSISFIENTQRPAAAGVNTARDTAIEKLKVDVAGIKRTLSAMSGVQDEILSYVKKLKRGFEADQLDIGKCCHTVRHSSHFVFESFFTV